MNRFSQFEPPKGCVSRIEAARMLNVAVSSIRSYEQKSFYVAAFDAYTPLLERYSFPGAKGKIFYKLEQILRLKDMRNSLRNS